MFLLNLLYAHKNSIQRRWWTSLASVFILMLSAPFPSPPLCLAWVLGCALTPTQDPDICAPTKVSPEICGKNSISEVKSSFIGSVGWGEGGVPYRVVYFIFWSMVPDSLSTPNPTLDFTQKDITWPTRWYFPMFRQPQDKICEYVSVVWVTKGQARGPITPILDFKFETELLCAIE